MNLLVKIPLQVLRYTGVAAAGMALFLLHGAYEMLQAFKVSVLSLWLNSLIRLKPPHSGGFCITQN